jgi:hypothetical protein
VGVGAAGLDDRHGALDDPGPPQVLQAGPVAARRRRRGDGGGAGAPERAEGIDGSGAGGGGEVRAELREEVGGVEGNGRRGLMMRG